MLKKQNNLLIAKVSKTWKTVLSRVYCGGCIYGRVTYIHMGKGVKDIPLAIHKMFKTNVPMMNLRFSKPVYFELKRVVEFMVKYRTLRAQL